MTRRNIQIGLDDPSIKVGADNKMKIGGANPTAKKRKKAREQI